MAASSVMVRTFSRGTVAVAVRVGRFRVTTFESTISSFDWQARPKKPEPITRGSSDAGFGPYQRVAPVVNVVAHDPHPLRKADLRLPAEIPLNLRDVGPGAIWLSGSLRNVDGWRRAQQADQFIDADRSAATHIIHISALVARRNCRQGVDYVGDVSEVTALFPVTHDRERLAGRKLRQEHAKNRAVGSASAGSRTVNIEEPQRDRRQSVDLRPMQDELLAKVLGRRVGIARVGWRGFDLIVADPFSGEVKKKIHSAYPNNSAALTTAGGLVFTGFTDGTLVAHDDNVGAGVEIQCRDRL
jgi:hypothetical protein